MWTTWWRRLFWCWWLWVVVVILASSSDSLRISSSTRLTSKQAITHSLHWGWPLCSARIVSTRSISNASSTLWLWSSSRVVTAYRPRSHIRPGWNNAIIECHQKRRITTNKYLLVLYHPWQGKSTTNELFSWWDRSTYRMVASFDFEIRQRTCMILIVIFKGC